MSGFSNCIYSAVHDNRVSALSALDGCLDSLALSIYELYKTFGMVHNLLPYLLATVLKRRGYFDTTQTPTNRYRRHVSMEIIQHTVRGDCNTNCVEIY